MFERYTEKARRVIFFARYEASQLGSSYIETEHILLGLLREDKALAMRFLGTPIAIESIRKQIEAAKSAGAKVSTSVDMPLSHQCKRVLAYASEETERLNNGHVDTKHLLLGLLREEDSYAARLLRERGITFSAAREVVVQESKVDSERPLLPRFGRDLTQLAREGNLSAPPSCDPVLDRVIDVLWRRTKSNPVLIANNRNAAAAVVDRLAERIAAGDVPDLFTGKRVLALDLNDIASQSGGLVDANARVRQVINELIDDSDAICFFLNDLESLFSPGGRPGASGHVLWLAAVGNRLRCICAATSADFHKWIENSPLLKPHFEAVEIR